jgi:hypothetical protein
MRIPKISGRWILAFLAAGVIVVAVGRLRAQQAHASPMTSDENAAAPGAAEQMSHHDHHHGAMAAHMKWTTLRSETAEDRARGEQLLATLRKSIEKYKDYRVALDDGYKPFHAELPFQEYHFTNYSRGFWAAFRFDPEKPTSLLYTRTADGWQLSGAMYTAPARYSEEQLNERVPLSVARWHAHVNVCMPKEHPYTADMRRFGPAGSISTKEACEEAGGRFYPQIFGWMVHTYPFESDPEKVWAK